MSTHGALVALDVAHRAFLLAVVLRVVTGTGELGHAMLLEQRPDLGGDLAHLPAIGGNGHIRELPVQRLPLGHQRLQASARICRLEQRPVLAATRSRELLPHGSFKVDHRAPRCQRTAILLGEDGAAAGIDEEVIRQPLGVFAAIAPFNFPLNLVAHKLAPAGREGRHPVALISQSGAFAIARRRIWQRSLLICGAILLLFTSFVGGCAGSTAGAPLPSVGTVQCSIRRASR